MTVASAKDGRSTQEVPFFVDPTNWMDTMLSASIPCSLPVAGRQGHLKLLKLESALQLGRRVLFELLSEPARNPVFLLVSLVDRWNIGLQHLWLHKNA
jgi:hypothetical protein